MKPSITNVEKTFLEIKWLKNLLQKQIQLLLEMLIHLLLQIDFSKSSFVVFVGDRRLRVLSIVIFLLHLVLHVSLCLWSCLSLSFVYAFMLCFGGEMFFQFEIDRRIMTLDTMVVSLFPCFDPIYFCVRIDSWRY